MLDKILSEVLSSMLTPIRYIKNILNSRYCLYQQTLYSNLCDIICEDILVKVEEFEGMFYMDVHSHLFKRIFLTKDYEKKLVKYCLEYMGTNKDIIDVGANIGFYSILFAKINQERRVLSIEPTERALARLYKNIDINNVADNIIVFEGVVKDNTKTTKVKVIEGKEEYSTIGEMVHPSIKQEKYETKAVNATTIDLLVDEFSLDPGFIKMDVEGAENLVISGASKTIQEKRPIILSELYDDMLVANGSSAQEIIAKIIEYGYIAVNPDTGYFLNKHSDTKNILFIPKEKYA